MADFDPLTGLPNRRHIDRRLDAAVQAATASQQPLALVMIDLDNFKTVNGTPRPPCRRPAADRSGAAPANGSSAPASTRAIGVDTAEAGPMVGRLGGDEFLVLLPQVDDKPPPARSPSGCSPRWRCRPSSRATAFRCAPAWASRSTRSTAAARRAAAARLRPGDVRSQARRRQRGGDLRARCRPRRGAARAAHADLREALAQTSSRCTTRRWSTCGWCAPMPPRRAALAAPEFGTVSPAEFVPLLERSG